MNGRMMKEDMESRNGAKKRKEQAECQGDFKWFGAIWGKIGLSRDVCFGR